MRISDWSSDVCSSDRAERELRSLRDYLAAKDEILSDHGNVLVASLVSVAVGADDSAEQTRIRVCRVLGRLLAAEEARPLSALAASAADEPPHPAACAAAAGMSHPAPESRIPSEHPEPTPRHDTPSCPLHASTTPPSPPSPPTPPPPPQ